MTPITIFWVDLRMSQSEAYLSNNLPPVYRTQRFRHLTDLLRAVQSWRPWAMCLECDRPDALGPAALLDVMARHTSLPIILLTEQRIWQSKPPAPRDCIWEHLVKPVSVSRFCECLERITQSTVLAAQPAAATSIAGYSLADGKKLSTRSLLPAVSYVSGNYSEKLRLSTAAKLCDLSRFQFSRTFKKEQGLTFRDFVVQQRIQRAADLMRQSRELSITEVAFAVGFNDLSYFSRIFRRQFGVTPSIYRRTDCEPTQLPLFAPDDTKKT